MNSEIKKAILEKIKSYDKIIISRHTRPDGDAIGSTLGLAKILRLSFPEKKVLVANDDYSEYVSFLGKEDGPLSDEEYKDALSIILDSGTPSRISNKQYTLAKEIIKIDHHIDVEPYGNISWVEEERSSACEMVVDFYVTFKDELKFDPDAALCLFTGMCTDSGRFKYDSTSGDTLRLAAVCLDQGIDMDTLFARLYLEEFDYYKFQSYVFGKMQITENGVAYIYVDKKMQKKFNLNHEQASNVVSMLSEIKGSIIWLAFIDNEDGSIRVRLRSRFTTVDKLGNKYHGGGHAKAAGGTVYSKSEMKALIADADAICKEFKENNFYL
ncbi:MAG: bifunctional oligoribonuclease/PAP phosphatase NrnA [Lachnospiraceae bacterium]|nr:bifunctional oligoribonuclease/PAP phosphatase NrnA [Lachnospiraceae bacterium]